MKFYSRVRVVGHPRAATHYVYELLHKNFGPGPDDPGPVEEITYGNHPFGSVWELSSDVLTVYVWRDVEETVQSLFAMRGRFGLVEDDPGRFRERTLADMWSGDVRYRCTHVDRFGNTREISERPDVLLQRTYLTPENYVRRHQQSWKSFLEPRVVSSLGEPPLVAVEGPLALHALHRIAPSLRSGRTTFAPIEHQVGWKPA